MRPPDPATSAPPPAPHGGGLPARVVLHTRPGCHLCDVARDVVVDACASAGAGWSEVDVDSPSSHRDGLHERWTDLVPVVTVDGRHHAHFRVDRDALVASLGRSAPAVP